MDLYSKIIAYLKVLLPVAALALLSTLFLISDRIQRTPQIPFGPREIERRIAGQQVTAPYFAGTTKAGHSIMIAAGRALKETETLSTTTEGLEAEIILVNGQRINMLAKTGTIDPNENKAILDGNVRLTTSDNMQLLTNLLEASLDHLDIFAPTKVRGNSNFGAITAGMMRILPETNSESAQILFTNGVRVLYEPSKEER